MSRCFPFPPPGYEKKAWPDDDANFLIKEKHKEKKHKKEKKDKEKKEKREKKDKERSGEKNREKKDRKRKHKDKDKNKEKEEKDSEEKKVVGSSSHQNGEKLGPIRIQVDQTEQGRLLLELEKRVGNQNGARETHSVDKSSVKELGVKSSGKVSESSLGIVVEGNQKFKNNREENRNPNGQSLKVSAKNLENGFLGNILAKEQKIVEGAVCQENVSEKRKERKDKNKHKSSDDREDKHKDGDRERKSKSKDKKEKKEKMKEEKVKEVSTPVQSKLIENCNNDVDIQNDRGSYLFKGSSSNNGNLGKRKEPEMNGLVLGNGSPISKLPRPLSSSKVGQNGSRNDASNPGIRFPVEREAPIAKHKLEAKASCSSSISEEGTRLDNKQSANNYAPESHGAMNNYHHKTSESLSTLQPPLGIGRNLEHCQTAMNFVSKEQGMVANHKLNKKVLYSQSIAENGRKLQPSLPSTFSSAERQGAVSKPKLDYQQSRTNSLGLRKPDACSMRPSPVAADQLKETVMKPPHPDAKYLSEILSVPKVEWSDIDDQAWLFPREDHGGKKPKIDSTTFEESKQVWAEALQLESADVTALPYVIPY